MHSDSTCIGDNVAKHTDPYVSKTKLMQSMIHFIIILFPIFYKKCHLVLSFCLPNTRSSKPFFVPFQVTARVKKSKTAKGKDDIDIKNIQADSIIPGKFCVNNAVQNFIFAQQNKSQSEQSVKYFNLCHNFRPKKTEDISNNRFYGHH